MVQKKGKISKKESNKVKKGKCTLNKICRPWLLKSVNQKARQTDQFSLNDQLYDCFVCDESRGLLVLSYVLCNAILIEYVLWMKWMIPFQVYIKDFHKRFRESSKFIIFTDITRLLIAVEQNNSMSYTTW